MRVTMLLCLLLLAACSPYRPSVMYTTESAGPDEATLTVKSQISSGKNGPWDHCEATNSLVPFS